MLEKPQSFIITVSQGHSENTDCRRGADEGLGSVSGEASEQKKTHAHEATCPGLSLSTGHLKCEGGGTVQRT